MDIEHSDGEHEVVLVPRLLSVAKSVRQLCGIALAEIDVVVGQDQFLLCFDAGESRMVAELAGALSVRPSTISKMVDILERKGWAVREPDRTDARKVLVRLTPAGLEKRDLVRLVWQRLEAEILQVVGRVPNTTNALQKIEAALTKRLSRLR